MRVYKVSFSYLCLIKFFSMGEGYGYCICILPYSCRYMSDLYLPLNYNLIGKYLLILFLLYFIFALSLKQGSVYTICSILIFLIVVWSIYIHVISCSWKNVIYKKKNYILYFTEKIQGTFKYMPAL